MTRRADGAGGWSTDWSKCNSSDRQINNWGMSIIPQSSAPFDYELTSWSFPVGPVQSNQSDQFSVHTGIWCVLACVKLGHSWFVVCLSGFICLCGVLVSPVFPAASALSLPTPNIAACVDHGPRGVEKAADCLMGWLHCSIWTPHTKDILPISLGFIVNYSDLWRRRSLKMLIYLSKQRRHISVWWCEHLICWDLP